MRTTSRRSLALVFGLLLALPPALADTIYLTDGRTIEDAEITSETMTTVAYKAKGKGAELTVPSDSILKIEYSKLPKRIDEAKTVAEEGAIADAAERLELYADGIYEGQQRERKSWAPPYAMRLVLDLRTSLGDAKGVVEAADKLIARAPDSRHVPHAYLTKAEAQRFLGKGQEAQATLQKFREVIDAKSLSDLWRLELRLAEVLSDPALRGTAKRDRLVEIASEAGSRFPTVRNRARVAEGESYLEGEQKDFAKAEQIFEKILEDPKADAATLAGAYTGRGDCRFQKAVDAMKAQEDATELLKGALMDYLRVVVVFSDQTRYVPKAIFFAGRTFDFLDQEGAKANARKMYTSVIRNYPQSEWANQAKGFRR